MAIEKVSSERYRSFYKLCLATLIAVYILILVGGVVRSTGSGMGCPDWPTCFGQWIPPTSVNELPANYKEIYSAHREKKNKRFAKYLTVLGFKQTASELMTDESIREEADFNALKTWIEYLNRLVGVVIGLLITAVFIVSIRYWKTFRSLTWVGLISLLLVIFQGWLGSFVVSTNLTPWTVTVHMFLALVIVALLTYLVDRTKVDENTTPISAINGWLIVCIITLLLQILLGTQVRESIDRVATVFERNEWIENLGQSFLIHRSFSWFVLLLHVGLTWKLWQVPQLKRLGIAQFALVLLVTLTGIGMAYWAVPSFLQPVHLVVATMAFGLQMFLLFHLNRKKHSIIATV